MISKAQRGDLVEGWNDCPSNLLMPKINTNSRTRRKVQRVSHAINESITKPDKEPKSCLVTTGEKPSQLNNSDELNSHIKDIETKILEVLSRTSLKEIELTNLRTQLLNAYSKISPNDKIIFNNIFLKIQQLANNPDKENVDQLKKEISLFKTIQNEVNESCNLIINILNSLKM